MLVKSLFAIKIVLTFFRRCFSAVSNRPL